MDNHQTARPGMLTMDPMNAPLGQPRRARRKKRMRSHPIAHPDGASGPSRAAVRRPPAERLCAAQLELSAVSTAPRRARAAIRATLAAWDLDALTGDAEAITSELVTDAVAASRQAAPAGCAPGPVWLTITATTTELHVNVWDPNPNPPADYLPGPWDEDGRGLLIVKALSHFWGWYHPKGRDGKLVWAALITGE